MTRIELRPRGREHVEAFWRHSKDTELRELFPFEPCTLQEAETMFDAAEAPGSSSFGRNIFVDGCYVGDVWCFAIDEEVEHQCQISIVIFDRRSWGRGIGARVLGDFGELVFERFAVDRILAHTFATNPRSIGCLEKLGFERIEEVEEGGVRSFLFRLARDG